MAYTVLLFYKYVTVPDPALLKEEIRERAEALSLKGRVLVAEEGLNGTLEGETANAEAFAKWLLLQPLFSDINIKTSEGTGTAFKKLAVKVRTEIVGTKFSYEEADPRIQTAPHLPPEEMKKWYTEGKDFVVIDMRNDYEFASGHFKNSVNPGLEASRDLPQALPKLEAYKDKTVVTVCTGGVRCEKMSAYLMNKGFKEVYQLENGMHAYMEKYPGEDFLGALYTFDERKTMHFGGNREVVGTCRTCGDKTERYANCANLLCHLHFLVCETCAPDTDAAYCGLECRAKHVVA